MEPTQALKQAVKDYKEGKEDAFTPLYQESSKYIYVSIYKAMSGNDNTHDIINDIMQETYVEISKHIEQLENVDKFLIWAGRVATNKCYAYIQKNKKYILLNEEDNTFEDLADDDKFIPESIMQSKEKQRLIKEIIDTQLTEMQKLCIVGYYYNEQKQSEIAQELGIPENTVKTNLSRAKAKIKEGVLDLEKNKSTKLYSVAPFLLLLFTDEVMACVVPETISTGVMSAINQTGNAVAQATVRQASSKIVKEVGKKAFATAIKTKVIVGVVTLATVGSIGAGIYTYNQRQKDNTKHTQTEAILEEQVVNEEKTNLEANTIEDKAQPYELSQEEKENLRVLAQYITKTSYGEDLNQTTKQMTSLDIWNFIGYLNNDNYGYNNWKNDKYLPGWGKKDDGYREFTLDEIQDYASTVFDTSVRVADLGSFFVMEENKYIAYPAQYETSDICIIDTIIQEDDVITVKGTHTFAEWNDLIVVPTYLDTYEYTLMVKKNEASPFGFTYKSISYTLSDKRPFDTKQNAKNMYMDVLGAPTLYPDLIPESVEMTGENYDLNDGSYSMSFALADIDNDSEEELLIGYESYGRMEVIVNILKYDVKTNSLIEFDNGNSYMWYGSDFVLYDTGILTTCVDAGINYTYFWNVITGESWEGPQFKPEGDYDSLADAAGHSELASSKGKVVGGTEGDNLYQKLNSGNVIPLNWIPATYDNLEEIFQPSVGSETEEEILDSQVNESQEEEIMYLDNCKVAASSELTGGDYDVQNLLDWDFSTAWVEGVSGLGLGESITFATNGEQVSGLEILPGYFKSKDIFQMNARPIKIQVKLDDDTFEYDIDLKVENFDNPQESILQIDFGMIYTPQTCTITILDVDKGTKFKDTCISELHLYKK